MKFLLPFFFLLAFAIQIFAQNTGDLNSAPVAASMVFQKKVVKGKEMQIYVRLILQNANNATRWVMLSKNGVNAVLTNKMEMFRPCGKGCAAIYKFSGSTGFYLIKLPANAVLNLDSFILDGFKANETPKYYHVSATDALVIGTTNVADLFANEEEPDNVVNAIFAKKYKHYEKEMYVGMGAQGNQPPNPLVMHAAMESEAMISYPAANTKPPMKKTPLKPAQ